MTTKTYKIDERCTSNPDCLRIHVASSDAVNALACVFPAMVATGGYRDSEWSNGILFDHGSDVLDIDGGVDGNGWEGWVWHENSREERLVVQVHHTSEWNSEEERIIRTMITTVYSNVLGYASKRTYTREIKGNSYKSPRINGRRECAKAVAQFLADVTSAEAIETRAARAALDAQMRADSLARATVKWERAVISAVSVTSLSEADTRARTESFLKENGGRDSLAALYSCTKHLRAIVNEKLEMLTESERWEHHRRVAEACMELERRA